MQRPRTGHRISRRQIKRDIGQLFRPEIGQHNTQLAMLYRLFVLIQHVNGKSRRLTTRIDVRIPIRFYFHRLRQRQQRQREYPGHYEVLHLL